MVFVSFQANRYRTGFFCLPTGRQGKNGEGINDLRRISHELSVLQACKRLQQR